MTSMWANQSDWSASWKVAAGSAGTRWQTRAISFQLGPACWVSLSLGQAGGLGGVARGEGDGSLAADDERAKEIAFRGVGLAVAHFFQFGGDAAEAESQHLRVVRNEVARHGAAVAGSACVEGLRLVSPTANALLPGARFTACVRFGEGGVEIGTDDELAVEDLHRQMALHYLAEEEGATDNQRLAPEAVGQGDGLRGGEQAVAEGVEHRIDLRHDAPVVRRPDFVPRRAAGVRTDLVAEVVAAGEGEVLLAEAADAR